MPTEPQPKLLPDQHETCARRIAVLEGWALRTWHELRAVYGANSLVARAAEAAQHQARTDHSHDKGVAAHYQPPPRPPGAG
jgi:hypothetical protein